MILQKPALKKVKQAAGHNIQSWAKYNKIPDTQAKDGARSYGTERGTASQLREEKAKEHVKDLENQQRAKQAARQLDKEFFLSVLHSTATKREARSYIKSFTPAEPVTPPTAKPLPSSDHSPRSSCGVNLGGFYRPAAVGQSPTFLQQPAITPKDIVKAQLHVALVKIRAPQTLDDETLNGIGRTLSQLGRLGLVSVVVVDCDTTGPSAEAPGPAWKDLQTGQANRIIAAIDGNGNVEARLVDNAIGALLKSEQRGLVLSTAYITMRKLLMTPLRRGIIPVIPPFGYTDTMQTLVPIPAGDIVVALAKELTGLPSVSSPDEDPKFAKEQLKALRDEVSLDRLIILDPLGGIPATDRPNGYHVFLNMEQEFDPAHQDLIAGLQLERSPNAVQTKAQGPKLTQTTHLDSCNPVSKFTEIEFGSTSSSFVTPTMPDTTKQFPVNWHHLQNLQLTRTVLSMLPPSSSALLTSPEEASNSTKDAPFQAARVGTRRQRNPLIHNLLTDKPVFSSSLPVGRLAQAAMNGSVSPAETITPTTFAKHGMPVTIFPDPKTAPWTPPVPGQPHLNLTDPQIDLPRLVHLIEDSFNRKLDVKDYLNRVNGRVAGVIIAGEYEGGALLTWELPPGVPDDGSPESRARMVPYLDKFAVLKKSQGSGGVADLIFKAMVRDCFPNGCVWRSRKNNPVNKWYFERSRGTWKLPGEGWTMFWTTPELDMDEQLFLDYEGVCRGIQPSWADNKTVLD